MTLADCFPHLNWAPRGKAPSRKVCRTRSRDLILSARKRQRQARKARRRLAA